MSKQVIIAENAPKPVARYSQGILVDNTLYVQGVIALDPAANKLIAGPMAVQARRVFDSLKAIVEKAGLTMADVVKVTAFLADLEDYPAFNEIYRQYFTADPPPVRTTVQARMPFGALVEVDVIAVKSKQI
ncbi:MAG: Rid family detoxifying hydrolase [Kiritimatiellae bacterium]|nr:Rid family detoxifying hydrolase [Kiritimatiellia bacterium]